jgi:hypothetical protein
MGVVTLCLFLVSTVLVALALIYDADRQCTYLAFDTNATPNLSMEPNRRRMRWS